jgi:hypothetical protein
MSQSVRTSPEVDARCLGPTAANSHASPKRQREETATGGVRRHEFPCLRCGLGWTGNPPRGLGWTGNPPRGLGWTGNPPRGLGWTGARHAQFPCKPEAPARGNRDGGCEAARIPLLALRAWMDGEPAARAWMDGGPPRAIPMQARSASERKPRRRSRGLG